MEAGTLIEQKTTDENGQILFKADLPVDGTYIVKEIYAPDGFVTSKEEKEFSFEYGKPEEAEVSYEFVFENEPTTVELTKTDLTTGKELPGAHLKVTDEDGNVIDEWVSTEKAHVIKELTVGKSYTMISNARKIAGMLCRSSHLPVVTLLGEKIRKVDLVYPGRDFGRKQNEYLHELMEKAERRKEELEAENVQTLIYREEPFIYDCDSISFQVYLMIVRKGVWKQKIMVEKI